LIDRMSPRNRPAGSPIMYQTWGKLLFMHWRFPAEVIRPHVPAGLELDLHDGSAWVGMTPFTMWGIRPVLLPALPFVSRSHELNVRTYVHRDGVPGVWFFSLDASNPLAVAGARLGFHLPYFQARMQLHEAGPEVRFESRRTHPGAAAGELEATWTRGEPLGPAQPDTLDFFLVERYALYAARGDRLFRARIHHPPWPLRRASLTRFSSTMLPADGLPAPDADPLLHAQGEPITVGIWPLEKV
jgi:uncharacterized protein YqjF (DUF2071 family)